MAEPTPDAAGGPYTRGASSKTLIAPPPLSRGPGRSGGFPPHPTHPAGGGGGPYPGGPSNKPFAPPPHLLRRARHVEVLHAERHQRVEDGVVHRRRRADRPGLADALGPELVERRRRLHHDPLEARQL